MKTPRSIKPSIGRKRRTLGWTLLGLGVPAAVVWIASGWMGITRDVGKRTWSVSRGGWSVMDRPVARTQGWTFNSPEEWTPSWQMWHGWESRDESGVDPGLTVNIRLMRGLYRYWSIRGRTPGFGYDVHAVALWPVPVLLCGSGAWLLRSGLITRRRAQANACAKCGYSLAGLDPAAACPECGKAGRTK